MTTVYAKEGDCRWTGHLIINNLILNNPHLEKYFVKSRFNFDKEIIQYEEVNGKSLYDHIYENTLTHYEYCAILLDFLENIFPVMIKLPLESWWSGDLIITSSLDIKIAYFMFDGFSWSDLDAEVSVFFGCEMDMCGMSDNLYWYHLCERLQSMSYLDGVSELKKIMEKLKYESIVDTAMGLSSMGLPALVVYEIADRVFPGTELDVATKYGVCQRVQDSHTKALSIF